MDSRKLKIISVLTVIALAGVVSILTLRAQPATGTPTRLKDVQETTTSAPFTSPAIKVLQTNGSTVYAVLGTGIVLDTTTTPPMLRVAVSVTAPTPLTVEEAARQADGTYRLGHVPTGNVQIYRNGLAMSPGRDVTVTGQTVTFTPAQGSLQDDIILAVYQ